jgi:hypothetical protein
VHFHYTPTSATRLNQVEGFFGILGKQSLGRTDFHSKQALRDHLDANMRAWNKSPTPSGVRVTSPVACCVSFLRTVWQFHGSQYIGASCSSLGFPAA